MIIIYCERLTQSTVTFKIPGDLNVEELGEDDRITSGFYY